MKKKIVTVIGARPQIIKAAAISRAIREHFSDRLSEIIVHTGQHYDHNMSGVFFGQLDIPEAAHNLNVGSGSHALQTSRMMEGLEKVLEKEAPDLLLVYGDTNSTLAAALTAVKMKIPVAHVEAGLRSFDKTMPEEINRITADHVSTILFAPTDTAVINLRREGFAADVTGTISLNRPLVVRTGDVMLDNALFYQHRITVPESPDPFVLATIHRDHNTDDSVSLKNLLDAISAGAAIADLPVKLPVHPRTREKIHQLEKEGWSIPENIQLLDPVSYLEMIQLESTCRLVATDSGGVQKEAYFFRKPCVILRPHTEWVEITANGNAICAGDDLDAIVRAFRYFLSGPQLTWPDIFGDGQAAAHICEVILGHI